MKPAPVLRHLDDIRSVLQPGDVIALRSPYFERFVPGYWTHLGMYVGDIDEGPARVLQARGYGVHTLPLERFLRAQYALLLRPELSAGERAACVSKGLDYRTKPFDFLLNFEEHSRVCCSELVYATFKESLDLRLHRWGPLLVHMRLFLPDDILRKGFSPVWISPELPPERRAQVASIS